MDSTAINRALAYIGASHHALIRLDLAEAQGVTRKQLHRRVEQGLLDQVEDGIFRISGAPMTWHERLLVACWGQGPEAMASHRCSASLRRLDGFDRAPFEIVVPRWDRRRRRRGVIVHESTSLRGVDRNVVDGIPCTSIVRTLIDLPAVVPERRADQAFEDALRKRHCTVEQLAQRFLQVARRGRRGTRVGRRLIEKRMGGYVPTMSEFERRVSELIETSGMPRPQRQVLVEIRGTRVYIDLAWPDLKIGIECDGLFDHATNLALPWDDDRQNELQLLGWFVIRITWTMLTTQPELLVAQIRQARRIQLAAPRR